MKQKVKNINKTNNTNLIKKVYHKLIRNKYDNYFIPLGKVDYTIDQLNKEINSEYNEFDDWAWDIEMCKQKYKSIRTIIIDVLSNRLDITETAKEVFTTTSTNEIIKTLPVNILKEKNNLDAFISYRTGYIKEEQKVRKMNKK